MSVSYLPTAAPVDLFNEADFRLGAFHARPGVREIQLDLHVERLEPRVFQVLIVLARSRNRTISRDALIALCWDGRFVSDDALNRTIGRLRQVFARDHTGSVTIETVPRLGYQLRVHEHDAGSVAPPPAVKRLRTPQRRHLPYWATGLFALVLAALAGGTAAYMQVSLQPADADIQVRAITSDLGAEVHPALAPSGSMIVYSASSEDGGRHLFLRTLDDGPVEQLTSGDAAETAPSWSPDGQRLAFVRTSPGRGCEIMTMALPRGPGRVVTTCGLPNGTFPVWLDNQSLVFPERANPAAPTVLVSVDVGTGVRRVLTNPAPGIVGDAIPAVSPDGRTIAFRRSTILGVGEVLLMRASGGESRVLTRDKGTVSGIAWAPDGKHVYVSTTRGGDFGLWRYDTARPDNPRRIATGLRRIGRLSSDSLGQVAFEAVDVRSEIIRVTANAQTPRTASTGSSAYPDLSPDGKTVLFASDRGGGAAIWTVGAVSGSTSPSRLVSREYDYVAWPRWSPSGRQIAFLATTDGRSQLVVGAADGGRLRTAFETTDTLWSPDWVSDDVVVLSANHNGVWRAWQIRLSDGRATPVSPPGWDSVRAGPGGRFYGTLFAIDGVWRVPASPAETPKLVAALSPIDWRNWAIAGDEVITVSRSGSETSLLATPLSGGPSRTVGRATGVASVSGVGGDPSRGLYLTRGATDESDLVLIETTRRSAARPRP